MKAAQLVEAAGIVDGKRIIADFAAGGFVKSYALSIETLDTHGEGTIVLGAKIPKTMWKRIVQAGRATDVWTSGTVHLAGAAIITGITFKPDSIDWLIEHHTGDPPRHPDRQPAVMSEAAAADDVAEQPQRSDLAAIPPGALLATVDQAMSALGVSRGTINNLMNSGKLVRTHIGRAVRIEVASIRTIARP